MSPAIPNEHREVLLSEDELRNTARTIQNFTSNGSQPDGAKQSRKLTSILEDVLTAAEARRVTGIYRVAAWNALSAAIDHIHSHLSFSSESQHDLWKRSFELYLSQSHNARPKSSKQLLASLTNALRRNNDPSALRQYSAEALRNGIQQGSNAQIAKASLQVLAQFLGKQALPLDEMLRCFQINHSRSPSKCNHDDVQNFIALLLEWVGQGDFGAVIAHLLSVILGEVEKTSGQHPGSIQDLESSRDPIWMQALEDAIALNLVKIDDLRAHIFPVLFKRDLQEYIRFLDRHGFQQLYRKTTASDLDMAESGQRKGGLLYAALRAGKELGLLYETEDVRVSLTTGGILFPIRYIRCLLSLQSRRARLTGLSLLITSTSITMPFPNQTMATLKKSLHVFFADADANFRSELFSLMHKVMDRFRAITAVLSRKGEDRANSNQMINEATCLTLETHHSFLQWLISFLTSELRPTASYQRHICALKTLSIISRSGLDQTVPLDCLSKSATAETKWPFHMPVMTSGLRRLLLDLILNPFDDVRQTAASILELHCTAEDKNNSALRKQLQDTIARAENVMLLNGRADQADGVARLYALLYRQSTEETKACAETDLFSRPGLLKHLLSSSTHMLEVARRNLPTAVNQYPMHGLLSSFRYVLLQQSCPEEFQEYITRLVAFLHEIWSAVHPVLCDDAPEGYLPEQSEDPSDVSTKDTLSYCWRALKESSLLLGTMMSGLGLEEEVMRDLGNLCYRQLAELRHRGAFSTVAQTWILCCVQCRSLTVTPGTDLLQHWYDSTLSLLSNRTTINTRRSAGIPALMCGLLIADNTERLLPRAFEDLANIARQPVDQTAVEAGSLPQVHALNCMKDILKNTRLGEQSEQYVPFSLRLAAESLRSEAWAVRNCGLMLFRAVIDRLFGTSEAHLDIGAASHTQLSANQYPELLEVILDLLQSPQIATSEGIFPTLQFLQHIDIPEDVRSKTTQAVLSLNSSKSWHIRDKAAQTYAQSTAHDQVARGITSRIENIYNGKLSQNALHGNLLCIKYLIRRLASSDLSDWILQGTQDEDGVEREYKLSIAWLYDLLEADDAIYSKNACSFTKATYVDIIAESLQYSGRQTAPNSAWEWMYISARIGRIGSRIPDELQRILGAETIHAEEHVLRSALAQAYAYKLQLEAACVDGEMTDKVQMGLSFIPLLARLDADACRSLLAAFSESQLKVQAAQIIWPVCIEILGLDVDMILKCEAQRLLLKIADGHWSSITDWMLLPTRTPSALAPPYVENSNQDYAAQWLQLQAVGLEQHFSRAKYENECEETEAELLSWMKHCCAAIRGDGLFTREAAAFAINQLGRSWRHIRVGQQEAFCDLCFGVYDLLNDDDEDIRILAAASAACIYSTSISENILEPACAREMLTRWMLKNWSDYPHFITQAAWRAFGVSDVQFINVAEQLSMHETTDSVLFAEERQNLYIDDAREVKVWSQIILRTQPKAFLKSVIRRLCTWISDGLDVLTSRAEKDRDGALGWTSKDAAFTLGLQVIYGAEFLLNLAQHGVKIGVRPSSLRLRLGKLGLAAITSEINALWTHEIERVIEWAIFYKLQSCTAVVEHISKAARN